VHPWAASGAAWPVPPMPSGPRGPRGPPRPARTAFPSRLAVPPSPTPPRPPRRTGHRSPGPGGRMVGGKGGQAQVGGCMWAGKLLMGVLFCCGDLDHVMDHVLENR
jgi:hypothetical protein